MNGIGFLEPLFLWGLLFTVAVVLIHLLKRPRTVRLDFSTLRFFDETTVASNRSRRLRRLLLLLVRLLLAILLVVLFARPFFKHDPLRIIGGDKPAIAGGTGHFEFDDDGMAALGTDGLPATATAMAKAMTVYEFDGGGDGWATLKFHYDPNDIPVGFSEEDLRMYWLNGNQWVFDGDYGKSVCLGAPSGGLGNFGVNTDEDYLYPMYTSNRSWVDKGIFGDGRFMMATVGWRF